MRRESSCRAAGQANTIALAPFALYHFHRSGLYGVGANIIAIPLTTFIIMPLEAGALLLDAFGWGKPLWLLCGAAIDGLLKLAHVAGSARGAVMMLPSMPTWAFSLMVIGGIWLCLWNSRVRLLGLALFAIGAAGAAVAPFPDLLVTGDGTHLAVVENGTPLILRDRAGDYVRSLFAETAGYDGDPDLLEDLLHRPHRDERLRDLGQDLQDAVGLLDLLDVDGRRLLRVGGRGRDGACQSASRRT